MPVVFRPAAHPFLPAGARPALGARAGKVAQ